MLRSGSVHFDFWLLLLGGSAVYASIDDGESLAVPTQEAATPNCTAPPGVVIVALPSGLPPALRKALGDIALPGKPFDASDVSVKGRQYRRYIFVWNFGTRWVVATEQGGIALHSSIFIYRLSKDDKGVTLIAKSSGFVNNLCAAAAELAGR